MRFSTGTCWSCAIGLGMVPRTWASQKEKRGDKKMVNGDSSRDREREGGNGGVQAVIDQARKQSITAGQDIAGLAPTSRPTKGSRTAVTDAKITDGPTLVRRMGAMKWEALQDGFLGKRDGGSCPSEYSLCPSSVGGGCCPSSLVCGSASCLPVTAGPATACGLAGYFGCPIADGGGCCSSGYICASDSCSPSPGVASLTCSNANSFVCPASLGGGCCKNGMGCKVGGCYSTVPQTFTFTNTITTTDSGKSSITLTSTITSVTIVGSPDPTETITSNGIVPKIQASATAIAKTPTTNSNSSGGGLSTAALGGIIGGAIFFLSAILIAAIFIIRGLNRASRAQEMANSRGSSSGPRSGQHRPSLVNDIDNMSIDPLNQAVSSTAGSFRRPSGFSNQSTAHEMEGSNSPPVFLSPFSPRSPPHTHYPRGYNPVASSESQYSQSSTGYRNPSLDSSPPGMQNPNGYFDIPASNPNRVSMISSQGRRPSQHGRNWSNASDQSGVSQTSDLAAELDAGKDGSRKSSLQMDSANGERRSSLQRWMTRLVHRRQSDPPPTLSGGPVRKGSADWVPSPRDTPGGLGVLGGIAEAGESKLALDSYGRHSPGSGSGLGISDGERREDMVTPQTPFQDISLMDQPAGFRNV